MDKATPDSLEDLNQDLDSLSIGCERPNIPNLLITNLKMRFKFRYLRFKFLYLQFKFFYLKIKTRIFYFQCARREKVLKPIERI